MINPKLGIGRVEDKYVIKGLKKGFSLARIKLGLAREYGTKEIGFDHHPLELILRFSGKKVETLDEGYEHLEYLKRSVDLKDPRSVELTFIQLLELGVGAKQDVEATEDPYTGYLGDRDLPKEGKANILIFSQKLQEGLNFYVGREPPRGSIALGWTQSAVVFFVQYAYKSRFSSGGQLIDTHSVLGMRNVLGDAMHFSLGVLGATTSESFS